MNWILGLSTFLVYAWSAYNTDLFPKNWYYSTFVVALSCIANFFASRMILEYPKGSKSLLLATTVWDVSIVLIFALFPLVSGNIEYNHSIGLSILIIFIGVIGLKYALI